MILRIWELTGRDFDGVDPSLMVLPVGALERHGDHLPLGTDGILALYVAEAVAEKLGAVLLPPIWYGVCTAMRGHRGTFDVSQEALSSYVIEVLLEAHRNGARLVAVINGHGGNTQALHYAAREASRRSELAVAVIDWWRDVATDTRAELFDKPGHAGEDETSAMLAVRGELVDMSAATAFETERPPIRVYSRKLEERLYAKALTGDASKASPDKGKRWLEAVVEDIVLKIREALRILGSM